MRTLKPPRHSGAEGPFPESEQDFADFPEEEADTDLVRVSCPDCAQSIALGGPGEALPEHALCPTSWDPFGLTVCPGSGRVVTDDGAAIAPVIAVGVAEVTALSTLPASLDWRLQPFSHASVREARLAEMPPMRRAA